MGRPAPVALALAAALLAAAVPASAQGQRHALVVEGASGEPQYAALHRQWVDALVRALRDDLRFDPARVTVLTETAATPADRATAENVRTALGRLAAVVEPGDLLFVMLIGHGSGQGADAKFNLVGPDLTVAEWQALFAPIRGRLAFVNGSSASFPYLGGLAGPERIVITATSTAAQRFHTVFAGEFIKALTAAAADTDKNARVSLWEAFVYASRLVAQHYEQGGFLATETAVLDDTGDGVGRVAGGAGSDGEIAGLTYLDVAAAPTSADPAIQALLDRQADLTRQVDELRRRRASMSSEAWEAAFEALIIDLALVSRDVRRRTGGGR